MSEPQVRMLALGEMTQADLQRWHRLGEAAIEPNPYLDPRYAVPLLTFGDHETARLAVVVEGDEWLAAAAVIPRSMPLLKGTHVVMSTGSALTDQLGRTHPLVSGADPVRGLVALIRGIAAGSPAGLVQLDDYFAEGPLAKALDRAVGDMGAPVLRDARGVQPYASRAWPGATDDQEVYGPAYASKERRGKMRRYARALSQHTGQPLTYIEHGGDLSAFNTFVELQASGWKGDPTRGGAALALRPSELKAFTRVFEECGSDGSMFVGGLYSGDRPVHLSVFLTDRRRVACVVIEAYDEEFGEFRAGSLGRLAAVAHMRHAYPDIDLDPAIRYPTQDTSGVYPDRRPMAGIVVAGGGAKGRALIRLAGLARQVRPERGHGE